MEEELRQIEAKMLENLGIPNIDTKGDLVEAIKTKLAQTDPTWEALQRAIISYNRYDYANEENKLINPWNPRSVEPSKGRMLKGSLLESGIRRFVPTNMLIMVIKRERLDPDVFNPDLGKIQDAPIVRFKDRNPVKIPGGLHRRWAVLDLCNDYRELRELTLIPMKEACERAIAVLTNNGEKEIEQIKLDEINESILAVEAAEQEVSIWGTIVVDEGK
jgi:hypothetical protein